MPMAGCHMRSCASAEDLAEQYFNATSPFVEQMDWEQLGSASMEEDAEGETTVVPSPHSNEFLGLQQLWENKWHGKKGGLKSPPLSAASKSLLKRIRQAMPVKKQFRRKGSGYGYTYGEDNSLGGMIISKSLRRIFSTRTSGVKLTKNGPCELFADWPIPRYPSDYDWEKDYR